MEDYLARNARRCLTASRTYDGMVMIEVVLPAEEGEEARDQRRCRFVACERRTCDAHHVWHYDNGGPTAVHNGALLCPRHHTAVHEGGFRITGDANATLTFHRPDGTVIGESAA